MNLILLVSLAFTATAIPTAEEIFKRASTSSFCKKAKSGCANSEEQPAVQRFCSSYFGLPPQKTKTFIDVETTTLYTTTTTSTQTTYIGSFSGGPHTITRTAIVTAADASTTTVTSTSSGSTAWVYPSQCTPGVTQSSTIPEVAARAAATQPACFSKYASSSKLSSVCSCYTLTASIPATSLIDTTTTISTASTTSTTTTITAPIITTTTTTITEITSTNFVPEATVSAFAMQDKASGNYATLTGDGAVFTGSEAEAGAFTLNSTGTLSWGTSYWAGQGAWQGAGGSPDFIRFENPTNYGFPMNPVTCQINKGKGGQCQLDCIVAAQGWSTNCLYSVPNDNRNGGWILTPAQSQETESDCQYVSAPLIMPLPN